MGRWSYSSRGTTGESKSISVSFLNKHHYFNNGFRKGGLTWSRGETQTGSVGFEVSTLPEDAYIRFQYTRTDGETQEKNDFDYKVRLVSTPCHFGGQRWWFICPLTTNNRPCNRRVGVLYLTGKYFGCRDCYNLTYESCKESHKYDSLYGILAKGTGLHPDFVKQALNRRNSK